MKKTYISPRTEIIEVESLSILATSFGVNTTNEEVDVLDAFSHHKQWSNRGSIWSN